MKLVTMVEVMAISTNLFALASKPICPDKYFEKFKKNNVHNVHSPVAVLIVYVAMAVTLFNAGNRQFVARP